jgi:hypothetical protein
MILIWGLPNDPSTRAVREWLALWRAPVFFLNHAEIFSTEVSLTAEPNLSFRLTCGKRACYLDHVKAAYLRPYDYRDYPCDSAARPESALVHHMISAWAEYSRALIVSRPSSEGANQSKLYQAAEIRAAGFLTPESLVTNDPAAIREFRARHGRLIYQSMSNVRSIVRELADPDLEQQSFGPALFQQRVEGCNVRVHVVGRKCFANCELPDDVGDRAVALSRRLGLTLAGLDLIRTASGDWYCLEANPNPAFTSFPDGERVARALARELADAGKSTRPAAAAVKRKRVPEPARALAAVM